MCNNDIIPMQYFFALALGAMLLGMLAASTAPSIHEDCGCTWQQEYTSLHAAIKLGRHAQRYTAVSYLETGELLTSTCCTLRDYSVSSLTGSGVCMQASAT